jgi:acyl-CoA thioesterase-1
MKIYLIALGLTLLAAGCGTDTAPNAADNTRNPQETAAAPPPAPAAARKQIVFFGNSLTAAYNLETAQGFPALIQEKIDSLGWPYTCVNAGLSGETTAAGKNRIDWVLQQPIDVFVLELGANDALRGLPLKQSKENLEAILQKVRTKYPDCKIVIAGMLAPPNLGASYTTAFRQMFTDLARAYDAAFIPFLLEGVAGDPALNLSDGIHPNVEGQRIVAENVWKVLQPMLLSSS